jgi:hypothetical protein
MEIVAKQLPADSSFVMTVPFVFRQMPTALHLPRTGEGRWYLTPRPGIIIDVPVTGITWTGNAFAFETEVRAGGLGGRLAAEGVVGEDGTISGEFKLPGGGRSPLGKFTGSKPN